jgi:hypothetical protein
MDTKLKAVIGGALLSVTTLVVPQIAQAQAYGPGYGSEHGLYGHGLGYGRGPMQHYHHPRADQIERRLFELQNRVQQGMRSGRLRRIESRRLLIQIRTIRHNLRVFMADGHLSNSEYSRLQHELNNVSRNIYVRERNNRPR